MSKRSSHLLLPFALLYASSIAAAAPSLSSRATNSTSQAETSFAPLGSGTDVFREGAACRASWVPDTTGATTWKSMTIQLMTGSNLQMTALGTVATGIDGTNPSVTEYEYACPQVSPNAAIYFLQYTHDGGENPTWTTRFTIADQNGGTVAPPEANQPQGGSPAIPWGEGTLVAVSTAAPATTSSTSSASPTSTTSKMVTTTKSAATATSTGDSFSQQKKNLANAFSSMLAGSSASNSNLASRAAAVKMANSNILLPTILVICLALVM